MNREIKFRAWDKEIERMSIDSVDLYNDEDCYINFAKLTSNRDIILMQYTGLKDKNGVEIYEGDILKGGKKEWKWSVEYGCYGDPHNLYVFNQYNSCRTIESEYGELYFTTDGKEKVELEVIGNIYENPELIKE